MPCEGVSMWTKKHVTCGHIIHALRPGILASSKVLMFALRSSAWQRLIDEQNPMQVHTSNIHMMHHVMKWPRPWWFAKCFIVQTLLENQMKNPSRTTGLACPTSFDSTADHGCFKQSSSSLLKCTVHYLLASSCETIRHSRADMCSWAHRWPYSFWTIQSPSDDDSLSSCV